MTQHNDTPPATIVILPLDVDDPDGWGFKDALKRCGIDRDAWPTLAEIIEAEWWEHYGDAAQAALEAAGYDVVRLKSGMFGNEMAEKQTEYGDDVYEGDELPVDMVAVVQAAEVQFDAWWKANAEALIAKHRPDWALYDADTGEMIGNPTNEQIDASLWKVPTLPPTGSPSAAGALAAVLARSRPTLRRILIDADGDVIEDGTRAAQQPGVRWVYVA